MTIRYTIVFSKLAESKFEQCIRADRKLGEQIAQAIERIASHPDLGESLTGRWRGYRKYRMGDYRIVYRVEHGKLLIYVMTIGHRKDVYRG